MKYFRKFGRRRNYRKRGLRKSTGKRTVSKSVKQYVKRAIHRNIENKEIISYAANQSCMAYSSGAIGFSLGLIPQITSGTGDNARIGNQIRIVRGILRGQVNLLPYNATTNPSPTPVWVKMFLYTPTYTGSQSSFLSSSTDTDRFFRGNNAALPFQANPMDLDFQINESLFRLLATKTFKLGAATASTGGPVTTGGYYDNSPMCKKFYFNWGKFCKKMIKFNDGTSFSQNKALYLIIQPVYADGSSTGAYSPVECHYVNTCTYEDA